MSSGKWEVAGKGKKSGNTNKKLSKKQKKDLVSKIPTADSNGTDSFAVSNPLKEHQNIYNLMNTNESLDGDNSSSDSEPQQLNAAAASKAKAKPKKRPPIANNKQSPPKSEREIIEDEMSTIDVEELSSLINQVKEKFPKHPIVWLKDILSYLQMKIKRKESDAGLIFYDRQYPLNMCSKGMQSFLGRTIREIPDQANTAFYIECLKSYAAEIRKGSTGYPYRIMLQAMCTNCAKTNGESVSTQLHQLIRESITRPRECVALLWCLQITPTIRLDTQLKVWFTWMLPMLQSYRTEKLIQDYIFHCIDSLLKETKKSEKRIELSYSDFFNFMDLIFQPNNGNIHPYIQKLMRESLDDVKHIAFSCKPEKRLRSFFPSLLVRLHSTTGKDREVILECLTECLQKDDHCFALWIQLYEKHLNDSYILLDYIHSNWNDAVKRFPKSALKNTLEHIITNLTPTPGKIRVKESARKSVELATDMMHAIGSPIKSAFKLTLVVIFALVAVYVLHDVKEFGSFGASRTGRLWTAVLQHKTVKLAVAAAVEFKDTVYKYGMKHTPTLMEYACTILNSITSTLLFFATILQTNFNYVVDNRADIAQQASKAAVGTLNTGYDMVMSWFSPQTKYWIEDVTLKYYAISKEYVILAYDYSVLYYHQFIKWFAVNFIEGPVTIERIKMWGIGLSEWTMKSCNFYYDKFVSTFLA